MKEYILQNAKEINRLHAHVRETFKNRDKNEHKRRAWQNACKEFHDNYDRLAFPGGLKGAYLRILAGDPEAMETAICFLEARPYFFRSGYMFKDILRKTIKAPLNNDQQERLEAVRKRFDEYKKHRSVIKAEQDGRSRETGRPSTTLAGT